MTGVLHRVRDLKGVEVVFITRYSGGLIAKEAPAEYTRGIIEYLASQVKLIFGSYEKSFSDMEDVFVRFSERSLFGNRSSGLLLIAITDPDIDLNALRIASELCLRHTASFVPDEDTPRPEAPPSKGTGRLTQSSAQQDAFNIDNSWNRIAQYLTLADSFMTENAYTVRVYRYGYFRALDMASLQVIISRISIDPMFTQLQRATAQKLLEALNRYEATAWSDFERLVKEAVAIAAQFTQNG